MLIVTRRPGQRTFVIVPPSEVETEVEVVFMDRAGKKARLGFKADERVKVLRAELRAKKREEVRA